MQKAPRPTLTSLLNTRGLSTSRLFSGGRIPFTVPSVTDVQLAALLRANIISFKHLQTLGSPLRGLALPGVRAFALPIHPTEALHQQQVLYEDAEALATALGAIEEFYRGHGVPSWRVQVPPGDAEAERALARAGYRPEDSITGMGLTLADVPLEPPRLPLELPETLEELITLGMEAFGPTSQVRLDPWHLRPLPASIHARVLREGPHVLAGGLAHDVGDTAGIYLVVTAPSARRRGLATEVMRGLLADARARGLTAAVLQSTELGHGVYQRLGFREVGAWTNWVCPPHA